MSNHVATKGRHFKLLRAGWLSRADHSVMLQCVITAKHIRHTYSTSLNVKCGSIIVRNNRDMSST